MLTFHSSPTKYKPGTQLCNNAKEMKLLINAIGNAMMMNVKLHLSELLRGSKCKNLVSIYEDRERETPQLLATVQLS